MNFNPPASTDTKAAILRALDFSDNGRGASTDDFQKRSGVDVGDFGRALLQMSNDGLVEDWGKSKWYGPGYRMTDQGREFLAHPPASETGDQSTRDPAVQTTPAKPDSQPKVSPRLTAGPGQRVESHYEHRYDGWSEVPAEYKANGWTLVDATHRKGEPSTFQFERLVDVPAEPCRALMIPPPVLVLKPAPKPDPFLEEIRIIQGTFEAGRAFDSIDLMSAAFYALCQTAWAAHALRVPNTPLRCPVQPQAVDARYFSPVEE